MTGAIDLKFSLSVFFTSRCKAFTSSDKGLSTGAFPLDPPVPEAPGAPPRSHVGKEISPKAS